MNNREPSRRFVIGLASASFGLLGACMTLPGALLPVILDALGINLMEAGSVLALQPVGFLIAVLLATRAIARIGVGRVITLGMVAAGLGFGSFGLISSATTAAAAMLVAGIGIGFAEVGSNAAVLGVARQRQAKVLNFVHLFFGVGSFLAPALAAELIHLGIVWRAAFWGAALATASVGILWWRVGVVDSASTTTEASGPPAKRSPAILLLAVTLGLYVGTEMGIGSWLSKFLVSEHGVDIAFGGRVLSLYWGGLAFGRLVLSVVSLRPGREEQQLVWLSAVACAGLSLAILAPTPTLSAMAFVLAGLGFSGIFPGVVALGGRYQPAAVAAATSVIITGAGLGNILIPWSMSAVAESAGLRAGMYVYAAMCGTMLLLAVIVERFAVRKRGADPPAAATGFDSLPTPP